MIKRYIEISRYEKNEKGEWLLGSYIQPVDEALSAIDAELDGIEDQNIGAKITLEIIEMEEEDYKKLPEFDGY